MSVLDGPGEGTWSVFAQKVVEERDQLRDHVESLKAELSRAKGFYDVAKMRETLRAAEQRELEALAALIIDHGLREAALLAERDEARANYAFTVERAANEKLDGYRELGARCAAAENERDEARAKVGAVTKLLEKSSFSACKHDSENHDAECARCLACLISMAICDKKEEFMSCNHLPNVTCDWCQHLPVSRPAIYIANTDGTSPGVTMRPIHGFGMVPKQMPMTYDQAAWSAGWAEGYQAGWAEGYQAGMRFAAEKRELEALAELDEARAALQRVVEYDSNPDQSWSDLMSWCRGALLSREERATSNETKKEKNDGT
jgi:hypothetical protein